MDQIAPPLPRGAMGRPGELMITTVAAAVGSALTGKVRLIGRCAEMQSKYVKIYPKL